MLQSRRSWLLFGAWWLLWTIFHTWIILYTGFSWKQAFTDGALSNLLLAFVCYAMSYSLRYYRPGKSNAFYLLPWVLILAGLWLWGAKVIFNRIYAGNPEYLDFIHHTLPVRYCTGVLIIGCFMLLSWVWYYITTRQEDETRKRDIEKLAREAELAALRQQLQPHFLFNTLNSISALAGSQPEQARHMIQQLSDFLRGTLQKDEQQLIALSAELKHLELYLDIEKVRFGHRLKTAVHSDEKALQSLIPALLLQPVVENALKFGLYDTTGEVMIRIHAERTDGLLLIRISNPYDPRTARPQQGTGFGLRSVNRRLYLLFGRHDLLHTQANETEFIVTIKVPQQV